MSTLKNRSLSFRDISSVKQERIGAYDETLDGRGYRFSLAGGTALAPGKLAVAATVDSNATNKTVDAAVAIGAKKVTFTPGGTITANKYQDGFLTVNDAAGEGITYFVKGHAAGSSSASMTVNLLEPVEVALTASTSEVSLTQNPYSAAVISVVDQADMAVGVPNVSITASYYGWIQTKGVCSVLADEAITAGVAVTTGSSVAGSVEAADAAGEPIIGYALVAAIDTEYREISLCID